MTPQCLGYKEQTSIHSIKVPQVYFQSTSHLLAFALFFMPGDFWLPNRPPFICQGPAQVPLLLQEAFPDLSDGGKKKKNLGMEESEIRYLFSWHFPSWPGYDLGLAMTLNCQSLLLISQHNSFLPGFCNQFPPLFFWNWGGQSTTATSPGLLHSSWEFPIFHPHYFNQRIPLQINSPQVILIWVSYLLLIRTPSDPPIFCK